MSAALQHVRDWDANKLSSIIETIEGRRWRTIAAEFRDEGIGGAELFRWLESPEKLQYFLKDECELPCTRRGANLLIATLELARPGQNRNGQTPKVVAVERAEQQYLKRKSAQSGGHHGFSDPSAKRSRRSGASRAHSPNISASPAAQGHATSHRPVNGATVVPPDSGRQNQSRTSTGPLEEGRSYHSPNYAATATDDSRGADRDGVADQAFGSNQSIRVPSAQSTSPSSRAQQTVMQQKTAIASDPLESAEAELDRLTMTAAQQVRVPSLPSAAATPARRNVGADTTTTASDPLESAAAEIDRLAMTAAQQVRVPSLPSAAATPARRHISEDTTTTASDQLESAEAEIDRLAMTAAQQVRVPSLPSTAAPPARRHVSEDTTTSVSDALESAVAELDRIAMTAAQQVRVPSSTAAPPARRHVSEDTTATASDPLETAEAEIDRLAMTPAREVRVPSLSSAAAPPARRHVSEDTTTSASDPLESAQSQLDSFASSDYLGSAQTIRVPSLQGARVSHPRTTASDPLVHAVEQLDSFAKSVDMSRIRIGPSSCQRMTSDIRRDGRGNNVDNFASGLQSRTRVSVPAKPSADDVSASLDRMAASQLPATIRIPS